MRLDCILTPSTVRHFPNAALPAKRLASIGVALNERFNFQVALRADAAANVKVALEGPDGWSLRVRRVGFVPVPHHNTPVLADPLDTDGLGHIPGFVPDPLFDADSMLLPQSETNAFWLTAIPAKKAAAGRYELAVTVSAADNEGRALCRPKKLRLAVKVHNVALKPRTGFDVTHWFYSDCLMTRYGTNGFDEKFWSILPAYLRDIAEHGQNVVYVPLFTPPLDGDKRPSQLLKVRKTGKNRYAFDWSDVVRYVRLAKACGIEKFEWCHLFTQWGCRSAIRVFEGQGEGEKLLWPIDTAATSSEYRAFLAQLLPELGKFLKDERIAKKSYFHISDEPHGDEHKANYLAAKGMLRELAPWMQFIDACSQVAFGTDGVIDMPVPSIATALEFHKAGIESWCYYCCGPRGEFLNHLMDTPLAKIAMHGFLFYRWPFRGFLHWGFNYWNVSQTRTPIDPFAVSDGTKWPGWAYGDTFLVYPGENGPLDSIRWEVFSEAMQDYRLLQTLGVDRDDRLLAKIASFASFPKDAAWRTAARAKLFARAEK